MANVLEDFHGAMDYDATADYAANLLRTYPGVLYCRHRHQVGEANTSVAGFRQWKHALRQQPRLGPLHGTLGVVAFYLAANIPHLPVAIGVIFGLLVLLSALCALANFAHRDPPLPPRQSGVRPADDADWEQKMARFTEGQ